MSSSPADPTAPAAAAEPLVGRVAAAKGPAFLFLMSGAANVLAYAYQVTMARLLAPAEYAILTVLFGVLLLETISTQVIQSATARLAARYRAHGDEDALRSFVRRWARRLAVLAAPVSLALVLGAGPVADALNVTTGAVVLLGCTLFVAILLTFALGLLQGLGRFVWLGTNLIAQAGSRLALGVVLVLGGLGVDGAFLAATLALALALVIAVAPLRDLLAAPRDGVAVGEGEVRSFALAAIVLLAYAGLTNADAVLARALLDPDEAGAYAGAITMGKVVLFAPVAVGFVLLERTARRHARGEPTRPGLFLALAFVLATSGAVAIAYALAPAELTRLVIGGQYTATAALVPWYGVAALSNALLTIWNAYFIGVGRMRIGVILAAALVVQVVLLLALAHDPLTMVRVVTAIALASQGAAIGLFLLARGER